MASVEGDIGYQTLEKILPSMKDVDKESRVWQDIKLSAKKTSYCVSDALGPYFKDMNLQEARSAPGFSLYFDAATNKMAGLSKHLDIRLTYWDKTKNEVADCLLAIISMTQETAAILKVTLLQKLDEEGLKLTNLLAISRDDPKVNQKLVREMKEEVKAGGGELLDFGSDPCHVAHNAFEKGLSKLSIDIPTLAISLHGFFKFSTIRRAQFADELMEIDLEVTNFKRHVSSRWLSLKPAAERIDKNWDAIWNYFLVTLPGLANGTVGCKCEGECRCKENARDGLKTKYYSMIKQELMATSCRTVLKMVIFISEKFTPFLTWLQSSSPIIHTLYRSCVKLLTAVASSVVKDSQVPSDSESLLKLNLKDETIWRTSPQMSPSAKECFKSLSSHTQEALKKELFQVFVTAGQYLQKNLAPLKSSLIRSLRALDPKRRNDHQDRGNASIVNSAKLLKRFCSSEIDSLSLQWDAVTQIEMNECSAEHNAYVKTKEGSLIRLDTYYSNVIKKLELKDPGKFDVVTKYLHLVLALATSNCSVERGFSVTKRLLQGRESMSLASVYGQKVTKDAIHFHGGSANVNITPSLLAAHFKAQSNYSKRVESEQKEKRKRELDLQAAAEASQRRAEERERKAKFDDKKTKLEAEEKQMNDSLKADEALYDGMMDRALKTTDPEQKNSALATANHLRETIKRKQADLTSVSGKIRKLMESKL